jgi:hypothetical protein
VCMAASVHGTDGLKGYVDMDDFSKFDLEKVCGPTSLEECFDKYPFLRLFQDAGNKNCYYQTLHWDLISKFNL